MFDKMSQAISKEEINLIESELNIVMPAKFVEHYLMFNGGIPTNPFFYSEESGTEIEIQRFSPIKYLDEGIRITTLEDKYLLFKQKSKLMSEYLPFANDYGANQICINLINGKIYIVYMDMGELTDKCFTFLANGFEEFIAGLSNESIDSDD